MDFTILFTLNFRDISYNELGSKDIDLYNEVIAKLSSKLMAM